MVPGSGGSLLAGMNEIAAVLLYVMSVDPESAESDAFWCFSEMMVESWAVMMKMIGRGDGGRLLWPEIS